MPYLNFRISFLFGFLVLDHHIHIFDQLQLWSAYNFRCKWFPVSTAASWDAPAEPKLEVSCDFCPQGE